MLKHVPPKYPAWAKRAGIQGVVHLNVLIGKDGYVREIAVEGGPEQLIPYAVDAVKQWQFRPRLINDAPVEVRTVVDVSFTMNQ